MADANDSLSNLVDTEINKTLRPGSAYDAGIDLGTSSRRWRRLYLGKDSGDGILLHDSSSNTIWELDYRGITRCKFEGAATLTPAAVGTPDSVAITFPGVGDDNFYALVTGNGGILVTDTTPQRTQYRLYAEWHAPKPVVGVLHNSFTAWVIYHAYFESGANANTSAGTWNNYNKMKAQLSLPAIPADLARVYWKVLWSL